MTDIRMWAFGGASALALVVGVLTASGGLTSAQSTTATATPVATAAATATPSATTAPSATPSATTGTFSSNEDPAHEANETAEEEAAEDAGLGHRGHGGASNEDPAHEANETAAQEAAEDAAAAASPTG